MKTFIGLPVSLNFQDHLDVLQHFQGQCKSSILLIESETEIVQLDPAHRSLLVSTLHRCIICRIGTKDQLVQVGSKDRKM